MLSKHARRLFHRTAMTVTVLALAVLLFDAWREPRPAVVVDVVAVGVTFLFLLRASPERLRGDCPRCGGAPDPVRRWDGRRLWTCAACGWESARRRDRPDPVVSPAETLG